MNVTDTCSTVCGALCCRSPKSAPIIRPREVGRLLKLAKQLVVDITIVDLMEVGRDEATGEVERRFQLARSPAGPCPFLDTDTNLCRIYEGRPETCRRFPWRPVQRCLLKPGGPSDPAL